MSSAAVVFDALRCEQLALVSAFEKLDGEARFAAAPWSLDHLGSGLSLILEGGAVFERAGVNVSLVSGKRTPLSIVALQPGLTGKPFVATGISMVLHPRNPYVPAFHANMRFFEVGDSAAPECSDHWWFGGGADLTPSYGFEEDATHFHHTLKDCCDRHDRRWYPKWKQQCDEYFWLRHRHQMRGIGGIFFDRLNLRDGISFADGLRFVTDAVRSIIPAYAPIVQRRRREPFGDRERSWQLLRRGRYAEFNLVYDRGTLFGLQTDGNIEAILMSLPPVARWAFDAVPEPGSAESDLERFLQPFDWAGRDRLDDYPPGLFGEPIVEGRSR